VKEPIPLHKQRDRKGMIISDSNGETVSVDFVKPNKNHHADIYVDANGELHEKFVTFFKAVQRAKEQKPLVEVDYNANEGWRHLFSIQRYDYLIVPDIENGFDPLLIDVCDTANFPIISSHLFRVQKMSSKNYLLRLHLDTSNKTPDGLKGITSIEIRSLNNFIGCVKVSVDRMGRLFSPQPIVL
jgi:CRISPR-associated endonuclease Csn1